MPLLIAEAQKLSTVDMVRGIVEEIIDVDQTFSLLPFVATEGKAYVYNREGTLAGAHFLLPNLDVPESATTFVEVTATLKILIGDVDVDNFINSTLSDTNSQKSIQIAHKAKAIARKFADTFVNGEAARVHDLSVISNGPAAATNVEFDGLHKLLQPGKTVSNGANGGALSFDKLDELIDAVKLGPDVFVASRRTIRDLKKLYRSLSSVTPEYVQLQNGSSILAYAGIPVLLNDFIKDDKTVGTSTGVCSTVFAARFNEVDGVHGIYGGGTLGFAITEIGQLEKRDATRTRVKWYVSLALKATHSLAALEGVKSA